jgi:hypothetical protein
MSRSGVRFPTSAFTLLDCAALLFARRLLPLAPALALIDRSMGACGLPNDYPTKLLVPSSRTGLSEATARTASSCIGASALRREVRGASLLALFLCPPLVIRSCGTRREASWSSGECLSRSQILRKGLGSLSVTVTSFLRARAVVQGHLPMTTIPRQSFSVYDSRMGSDTKVDYRAQVQQFYVDMGLAQALEFDRRLMWISAGGLALALAYVPTLAVPPSIAALVVLLAGAVLLAVVLVLTLWSLQWGVKIAGEILEACQNSDSAGEAKRKVLLAKAYRWNKILFGVMILGITCMLVFAGWALTGGHNGRTTEPSVSATCTTTVSATTSTSSTTSTRASVSD